MRFQKAAAAACAAALSLGMLVGCGGASSNAPQDVTFDTSTGDFSFKAVEGGDTYTAGVSEVLNDATGEALAAINGSATIDLGDGGTTYVWSEQTGSAAGLSDPDGDGVIDGTVVFREFSSSATKVGDAIPIDRLPVGHYVFSVVPAASEGLPDPETAYHEFTIAGTLASPEGFTAKVNDEGLMEVTAPSDYYLSCLTSTGLPTEMRFEVKDGGSVVDTFTVDDFSYTNTVVGPAKSFTFNNRTVTGTSELDADKDYTVTVTAVGDGDQIKDASAEASMASKAEPVAFSDTYDTTGSGTIGNKTVAVTLGTDASGANLYELVVSANDVAIYRESGSYVASEAAGSHDERNTFPEGATLTFSTSASDGASPVLDGATLTVASAEQRMGPGMPPGAAGGKSYFLEGAASYDGEGFDFGQAQMRMPF